MEISAGLERIIAIELVARQLRLRLKSIFIIKSGIAADTELVEEQTDNYRSDIY